MTPHFGGRISGVKNDAPFLTAAAALAALLVCQSAAAQGACDRRERVLSLLAEKYQETPVAVGVTTQGSLVEVLSHDTGKTWTIVITSPQGISCLLLTGEDWKKNSNRWRRIRRPERDSTAGPVHPPDPPGLSTEPVHRGCPLGEATGNASKNRANPLPGLS